MDRKEIKKLLPTTSAKIDQDHYKKVMKESIARTPDIGTIDHGYKLLILMEEMAELSKECSKVLRNDADMIGVMEEMIDVYLCLDTLRIVCGIDQDDLNKIMNMKIDREEKRNKKKI